jgi:hypothetical protein
MKIAIMNKVADTIVATVLLDPMGNKKLRAFRHKTAKNIENMDGKIYDSKELDIIYKIMFEMTYHGLKEENIPLSMLPARC